MAMKEFEVTIGGARIMMHSDRLADPLSTASKALKEFTKKRQKTDEDHETIARLEFFGGLYCDPEVGPFVPDKWVTAVLIEGARRRKLGRAFEANITVRDEVNPLQYDGPRTPEALWNSGTRFADRRSVGVQSSRTIRTRPMFRDWTVTFVVQLLDTEALNAEDIELALEAAGPYGIGDGRPILAGRFSLIDFKELKVR